MPAKDVSRKKRIIHQVDLGPTHDFYGMQVHGPGPGLHGHEIMTKGNRMSEGNKGMFPPVHGAEDILKMIEMNRLLRQKKAKGLNNKMKLKGLFGGGQ